MKLKDNGVGCSVIDSWDDVGDGRKISTVGIGREAF